MGVGPDAFERAQALIIQNANAYQEGLGAKWTPDTWTDEYAHLSLPGQHEIQSALLYDYRTNVASYPQWQGF